MNKDDAEKLAVELTNKTLQERIKILRAHTIQATRPQNGYTYQTLVKEKTANRALQMRLRAALRPFGVAPSQYMLLGLIRDTPDMTVSKLAKRMDTSLAFVTTTLNVLESRQLISREAHKQDNRAKVLNYTGGELLDKIEKKLQDKLTVLEVA